jgi:hypothetical protein
MSSATIGGKVIRTAPSAEEADGDPIAVSTLEEHDTSASALTNKPQTQRTVHPKDIQDTSHANFLIHDWHWSWSKILQTRKVTTATHGNIHVPIHLYFCQIAALSLSELYDKHLDDTFLRNYCADGESVYIDFDKFLVLI